MLHVCVHINWHSLINSNNLANVPLRVQRPGIKPASAAPSVGRVWNQRRSQTRTGRFTVKVPVCTHAHTQSYCRNTLMQSCDFFSPFFTCACVFFQCATLKTLALKDLVWETLPCPRSESEH